MPDGNLIRTADALDHHASQLQAIARAVAVAAGAEITESTPENPS